MGTIDAFQRLVWSPQFKQNCFPHRSKMGVLKSFLKGFRLFDKVRIGGQIGFVFGRRVRGIFNIRRLDKTVIGTDINCKKLSLLETRKTFLIELRKE